MNDILTRFIGYVQTDSESGNEKAMMETLKAELLDLGADIYQDGAGKKLGSNGTNLYAFFPGDPSRETLLFSCHMDTVAPGIGIEPIVENGIIRSAGDTILGGDDKSGITALMDALTKVRSRNKSHGPLEIVFTIGEEGGLHGSANLEYSRLSARSGYVLDSSGPVGKIIVQAPTQFKITAEIKGRSAHAGLAPESGVSAIQAGAAALARMKLLRIDEETTANVGTFKSEGPTNIVRDSALVVAEVRSLDMEKAGAQVEHMKACFIEEAEKAGAKVDLEVSCLYESYNFSPEDPVVSFVESCCKAAGIEPFTASTGGGSDANNYNSRGIKVLNLGCGVSGPHSFDESLPVDELERFSELVYTMIVSR